MTTISGVAQKLLEENGFTADASDVTITAQDVLDENGWTDGTEIDLDKLEDLMKNAINYINLETGRNIAPMTGTADSMTTNLTRQESVAVKLLSALMVRAKKEQGPNANVMSLSVSQIVTDPHFVLYTDILNKALARLRTSTPIYVERLINNSISIVNLHTGASISALDGTVGSKSLTATDNQIAVIKLVASDFLQAHLKGNIGNVKLSPLIMQSIDLLRGRSFQRT